MRAGSLLAQSVLLAVVIATAAAAQEDSPLKLAPAEHQKLFAEIKPIILRDGREPLPDLKDSGEGWFWVTGARIMPLIKAYCYSRDPAFLEAYVDLQKRVLAQRYVHPTEPDTWTGWWHFKKSPKHKPGTWLSQPSDHYMVAHGALVYYKPALVFIRMVRSDAELAKKYGDLADAWFKDITEREIPAWDKRGQWRDMGQRGGWYGRGTAEPDSQSHKITVRAKPGSGASLKYYDAHVFTACLVDLYRMTGRTWYRDRLEKCGRWFRSNWREKGRYVQWNWHDYAGPWDYETDAAGKRRPKFHAWAFQEGGFYDKDVRTAVACYDAGIVFSRQDMERLLRTNLEFQWLGNAKDPRFRTVDGKYSHQNEATWGKGALWTALSHFSPEVRELWWAQIKQFKSHVNPEFKWMWHGGAMDYLLECSKPVSWDRRFVDEIGKRVSEKER